ncbi:MAG: hypothetical protein ABW086_16800, partial [Sedimenticola sp.]
MLSACVTGSLENRRSAATSIADQAGLQPVRIPTSRFNLFGYQRFLSENEAITLYIEGDGLAWVDRRTVSPNPTPINPVALRLAAVDSSPNVVYLSRPCQYLDLSMEKNCNRSTWTSHRFSRDILDSYHQALNRISKESGNTAFHLVGFSGGAAIAALLASERHDVLSLQTVAGYLDHATLNERHGVSPLDGSLNPISVAHRLVDLPQLHFAGEDDSIALPEVIESFGEEVGS